MGTENNEAPQRRKRKRVRTEGEEEEQAPAPPPQWTAPPQWTPPPAPASTSRRTWILGLVMIGLFVVFGVVIKTSPLKDRPDPGEFVRPAQVVEPPQSPEEAALDKGMKTALRDLKEIESKGTIAEAIAFAKPRMDDVSEGSSIGARLLQAWAWNHMKWSDIGVPVDETTIAETKKDSDLTRGKRLCISGSIIEIAPGQGFLGKPYVGLLQTAGLNLVHFIAIGSTGKIVEQSQARFCGVMIGRYDYTNSMSGVGHAVEIVGMFDLPENRATSAPPAGPKPKGPAPRKEPMPDLESRVRNPE